MSDLRTKRVAEVRRLLAAGLTQKEAGLTLGLSRGYVGDLITDPDGARVARRKERQYGRCVCGAPTSYKTGGPAKRCQRCYDEAAARGELIEWTAERCLRALVVFAETKGRAPTVYDLGSGTPMPDAPRPKRAPGLPAYMTIRERFGGLPEALREAGLAPTKRGRRVKGAA